MLWLHTNNLSPSAAPGGFAELFLSAALSREDLGGTAVPVPAGADAQGWVQFFWGVQDHGGMDLGSTTIIF